MRKLSIKEYDPKPEHEIKWSWGKFYYDKKTGICIRTLFVDDTVQLVKNPIYELTFEDGEEEDTYHYVVLKKIGDVKYLVAEFYGWEFYKIKPGLLGKGWVVLEDAEEKFGIDFGEIRQAVVDYYIDKQYV